MPGCIAKLARRARGVCASLAAGAIALPAHAHGIEVVEDSAPALEQVSPARVKRWDLAAVGVGGVTRWTAAAALDRELHAAGYDSVSPLSQQLSFVIRVALKQVRLGLDVGGEVGMRRAVRQVDGATLEVSEFLGSLDLGYEVHSNSWLIAFPHAGFAFGSTDVSLPAQTSFSFDHPSRPPPRDRSLRQAATAVRVGFVVEHPITSISGGYQKHEAGGLWLSLGAGYLVPLYTSSWELVEERDERDVQTDMAGGPVLPLAGPYLQVAIGIAWFSAELER